MEGGVVHNAHNLMGCFMVPEFSAGRANNGVLRKATHYNHVLDTVLRPRT